MVFNVASQRVFCNALLKQSFLKIRKWVKKSEIGLFPAWQAAVKTFFISGDAQLLVIAL